MKISKKHLAPIHCASKDETRYNLNSIHFADDGSIVATNGHMLGRVVPKDMEKRSPFMMALESVKELIKRSAKKPVILNVEDSTPTRIFDELEFPYNLVADAEYPNWRAVHKEPKKSDVTFEIALSAHVLESMIAAARQFTGTSKGKAVPLKFTFTDNLSPAFVTVTDKVTGDVMEFSLMPTWL